MLLALQNKSHSIASRFSLKASHSQAGDQIDGPLLRVEKIHSMARSPSKGKGEGRKGAGNGPDFDRLKGPFYRGLHNRDGDKNDKCNGRIALHKHHRVRNVILERDDI